MESESAMNPAEIPGWGKRLFPLYDLAVRRFPSGSRFVEIGCFLGMSACYGAQAIKKSRKKIRLDCIDEWGGLDNWALNNEHEVWSFQGALEVLEKARKCVLESREPRCYEAFLHNLERCNVATIEPLNMSSAEASRRLRPEPSTSYSLMQTKVKASDEERRHHLMISSQHVPRLFALNPAHDLRR